MAAERGEVEVPPTLRALLAARLDQLDPAERRVLERGAVEGEVFHRGAVQALAPEEPQVTPRLAALVRTRADPSRPAAAPGEDGFRFRHLLIRDAAYDALPEGGSRRPASALRRLARAARTRAWSSWTRSSATTSSRPPATRPSSVSRPRARPPGGDRLVAAGRRALDREDVRAAAGLLERALS